jgi:hypothetical protein
MHSLSTIMFVAPGNCFISLPDPKGDVRYCHHLVSVVAICYFCILIFFSKSTGPIGTKLGRKFYGVFLLMRSTQKRNKRPKGVNKGLSIYTGIHYLLFICFYEDFCNVFCKKVHFRNIHNVII